MWFICVLAFITFDLRIISSRNVINKENALEGYMKNKPAFVKEEKTLAHLDKGIGNRDLRWPLGVVQYYIDHSSYDFLVAERVRLAMNSIEETSCVRFKPMLEPWTDGHFLHIINRNRVRECTHETSVNDTKFEIIVTIGIDCLQRRDILHLLMHALGFKDEVTHPQRDQYVRILWDNINPAYRTLFRIDHEDFPSRTEYDFNSIMHFDDRAFSRNGQATIVSLIPGLVIDPARELSPLDRMKLRMMFGHECNRREVGDLLDTCKNALHDSQEKEEEEENNDGIIEEEDNKENNTVGLKADAEPGNNAKETGGYDEDGSTVEPGEGDKETVDDMDGDHIEEAGDNVDDGDNAEVEDNVKPEAKVEERDD